MSLIEQLGGYEKTKDHRDYLIDFGNEFNRPNKYEVNKINNALLEYRSKHNIFEVGDYFVNYADDAVYTALSIDQNNRMHGKSGDKNVWTYFGRFGLRHATDEEIKAGKRLEVNQ